MFVLCIITALIVGVVVIVRIEIQNNRLLKTVTSFKRGTGTERDLVLTLLKSGIPKETIFHDLYLKKSNGKYYQVDVVVATSEGIIVFKVKRYGGWIFRPCWCCEADRECLYQLFLPVSILLL